MHFEQFVSEMTLASTLAALDNDNGGALSYRVSSDFLSQVVPNFKDVFGKHDDIEVRFELVEIPMIEVRTEGSSLSAELTITVVNPYNADYEALIIYTTAKAEVYFELLDDYTLIGHLQDGELVINDHKMLFFSELTLEELKEKAGLLTDFLMKKLN